MDVEKQREIIRLWNRREVLRRVRVPTGQVYRIGERGNNATL